MIGKICAGIIAATLVCLIPSGDATSDYKKDLLEEVIPETDDLKDDLYNELYTKFPNDISEKRVSEYQDRLLSLYEIIRVKHIDVEKKGGDNVDDITSLYIEILGHLGQLIDTEKGLIEIDKTEGLKESDYEISVNLYKELEHEYESLEKGLIEKLESKK